MVPCARTTRTGRARSRAGVPCAPMKLSDSLVVLAGTGLLFALAGGVSCDLQSAAPADLAGAAAGCPDVSSASAAAKVDWAKEFGIDAAVGKKIKAGVVAAL